MIKFFVCFFFFCFFFCFVFFGFCFFFFVFVWFFFLVFFLGFFFVFFGGGVGFLGGFFLFFLMVLFTLLVVILPLGNRLTASTSSDPMVSDPKVVNVLEKEESHRRCVANYKKAKGTLHFNSPIVSKH